MPVAVGESVVLPNGKRMTVSGLENLRFMGAWGHMCWLRTPRMNLRVQTGVIGTTDSYEAMNDVPSRRVGSVVAPAGFNLDIREIDDGAMTVFLASWRHWELSAPIAGRGVPVDIALDLLSHFEFADSPEGLAIHPVPGLGASVEVVVSANSISGVCGVAVRPTGDRAADLPHGTGKRVPGGEIWSHVERDGGGNVTGRLLVLSGETSLTEITHDDNGAARATGLAERLVVTVGR